MRTDVAPTDRVLIIGAGLAGLAAAQALASRGFLVTLVEARNRLGGRASSFTDAATGQLIDTCQHVSMGCCTNLAHFCRQVGIAQLLEPQPVLFFMTPDRRLSRLAAGPWPAPLHLARSFLGAHYLTAAQKLRVGWGLACLAQTPSDADPPFLRWLQQHGQDHGCIERFWGLVLTSALNETPERIGLHYARKVFVDGFLRHPRGFEVQLPRVPLGRLYGPELQQWLGRRRVHLLLNAAVRRLRIEGERVSAVETRQGACLEAHWYISTVPFDRLLSLLSEAVVASHPYFGRLHELQTSPITSAHLWYDRPITRLPHVVLVGCLSQWLFNRGATDSGEYYVQIVVSAARQFRGLAHEEIERRIGAEVAQLFPAARRASLRRARVVTEHAATFSAVPGVDRLRPVQKSPIRNLFIAGDWTATGWPATMEGAVRSGYLAAEGLLESVGRKERLVVPDLT